MGANASKANVLRPGAEWVSDDQVTSCIRCFTSFTLSRRRHHCRMCGGVYCSTCCPEADKVESEKIRTNPSFPAEQRALSRLCLSCRLPMWMLPMEVLRVSTPQSTALPPIPPPTGAQPSPPTSRSVRLSAAGLRAALQPELDGTIMMTVIEFCDLRSRSRLLQTHPAVRHCLPMPPIDINGRRYELPLRSSVAFVYPGIVATGDGAFSGGFRPGMRSVNPARSPVGHLGTGGGGSVYYALDRSRHCFVAVKLIAKDFAGCQLRYQYDRTFETIKNEITIQTQLNDRSIAPLHCVFQTPRHVVMVSDAGEGRTARSAAIEVRAHDAGPREPGKSSVPSIVPFTLRVIQGVTTALSYMASKGFVHRDVKLDNVILSRDYDHVRIIDFGLAERFNTSGSHGEGRYAPLGTPSYLSPENVRAVAGGHRRFYADRRTILACDVFSLGVMAYMMLSNKRVYGAAKDYRSMLRTAEQGIRCRGDGWESVPRSICELVESMLSYHASERPTFEEILSHAAFTHYAGDIKRLVDDRYTRVAEGDLEFFRRWDMVLDADDDTDDDEPDVTVANNGVPGFVNTTAPPSTATPGKTPKRGGDVSVVVCNEIGAIDEQRYNKTEREAASSMFPDAENRAREQSTRYPEAAVPAGN
uniref:Protein kinase n=1 Tax=Neobodo designis TaxID=312471 RepID=A0A7S1KYF9_NEODS